MKILDERNYKCKQVATLKTGDTFWYQDELHIVIDDGNSPNKVKTVVLSCGMVDYIFDDILVTPVDVECKIVK